jgi:hypothetical protein
MEAATAHPMVPGPAGINSGTFQSPLSIVRGFFFPGGPLNMLPQQCTPVHCCLNLTEGIGFWNNSRRTCHGLPVELHSGAEDVRVTCNKRGVIVEILCREVVRSIEDDVKLTDDREGVSRRKLFHLIRGMISKRPLIAGIGRKSRLRSSFFLNAILWDLHQGAPLLKWLT